VRTSRGRGRGCAQRGGGELVCREGGEVDEERGGGRGGRTLGEWVRGDRVGRLEGREKGMGSDVGR